VRRRVGRGKWKTGRGILTPTGEGSERKEGAKREEKKTLWVFEDFKSRESPDLRMFQKRDLDKDRRVLFVFHDSFRGDRALITTVSKGSNEEVGGECSSPEAERGGAIGERKVKKAKRTLDM